MIKPKKPKVAMKGMDLLQWLETLRFEKQCPYCYFSAWGCGSLQEAGRNKTTMLLKQYLSRPEASGDLL